MKVKLLSQIFYSRHHIQVSVHITPIELTSLQQTCSIKGYIIHFFVINLYTFSFIQCSTVLFKFFSILVFFFFCLFNGLFRSTKMKICWDFQSVFTSMVDASPSCKDVQNVMGQGWIQWNTNTMMKIFVASGQPPLKVRISQKTSNTILVHFIGRLFNILQTFANQWLPNFHINMTSSFMASFLGSLYSQQRPLDKLWGWLHYTLTS